MEEHSFNRNIFNGSLLTTQNFNLFLTLFTSKFNLSFKCSDELLKFIHFILPQPNNISSHFNNILKTLEISSAFVKEYLCSSCWSTKNNLNSLCQKHDCVLCECDSSVQTDCTIELYIFDINKQLNEIIKNEEETMIRYRNV